MTWMKVGHLRGGTIYFVQEALKTASRKTHQSQGFPRANQTIKTLNFTFRKTNQIKAGSKEKVLVKRMLGLRLEDLNKGLSIFTYLFNLVDVNFSKSSSDTYHRQGCED